MLEILSSWISNVKEIAPKTSPSFALWQDRQFGLSWDEAIYGIVILSVAFVRDSSIKIFSWPVFRTSLSISSLGSSFPRDDLPNCSLTLF